jgi:tetratricopeptide (TPR) repeat protein
MAIDQSFAAASGPKHTERAGQQTVADDAPDRRARALYRVGEEHFSNQRYWQAIEAYSAAYELRPLPGFLFNIAQCYRIVGDFDKAVVFFERYMGRYPNSPHRQQIEGLLAEMRTQARQQREADRMSQSAGGAERTQPRPSSNKVNSAVSSSARERIEAKEATAGESAKPSSALTPIILGAGIGLSAAFVTAGLVTGQLASDNVREFNAPDTDEARRDDLKGTAESLRTASIVTFSAAGAVALATGIYFWLSTSLEEDHGPRPNGAAVAVAPLLGGGAVSIRGSF